MGFPGYNRRPRRKRRSQARVREVYPERHGCICKRLTVL